MYFEIDHTDRNKNAFTSNHWQFRISGMPCGLHQAPATFQRNIITLLSPIICQLAPVCLNSIIVSSCIANEHMSHVRTVILLFRKAGITVNLKECKLFIEKGDYVWHVIRPGRLQLDKHFIAVFGDLKPPSNVAKLKLFFCLWNV